nr:hypothetical protein [Tanacetum cinerariifolium]
MPSRESPIGGVNVSSSTVLLLTESLLAMCILREESLLSQNSDCRDDAQEYDEEESDEETRDEESFDPISQTPKKSEDEGNCMESIFETTSQMDVPTPTSMNEAVKVAVQIQSDHLRDEAQRENEEFLKTVDENMQKIIKEQVKEQVKVQVFKILPRIEQAVNEQLEAKVLTRSSHSSRTSYAVVVDLSEMELKKILIEKIEGNKRRDDDADKDEEPSAGPDRGSKRRREGKEPESASALMKTTTRSADRDDDKIYKFKEGDFKRLLIQDIEDMSLLVQGKLTNLTVEERFAFNVSIRMFTRSIMIQRRVEDLQLGNKDKKNMLMRIDELHKFSDGTLIDVRTALDDRLKGNLKMEVKVPGSSCLIDS